MIILPTLSYSSIAEFLYCTLQVCRSIGDAYLKKQEFNREPLYTKFRLREPFNKPILSSEPSICVQPLQPHDQFLIFASDGLWEHLTNQEAVDIVHSSPRNVSYLFLCALANTMNVHNILLLACETLGLLFRYIFSDKE